MIYFSWTGVIVMEDSTVNENILKPNQTTANIINQKVKMWDWCILELMFLNLAKKVLSSL